MRKHKAAGGESEFSILTLDDDQMMTLTLQTYFQSSGYNVDTETDPYRAIERIREGHYDILLLDFLMTPICGDEVVSRIREFNKELFIVLLTGHKSLAPPIKTIRALDIQGYYEKSDRFDQLELLVESCAKSIRQMHTINRYRDGLSTIIEAGQKMARVQELGQLLQQILTHLVRVAGSFEGCIYAGGCFAATEATTLSEDEAAALLKGITAGETPEGVLPLKNGDGEIIGIIYVQDLEKKDDTARGLIKIFAKQASAAVTDHMLCDVVRAKNRELEKAYTMLNDNYFEMTSAVRSMVDARDIYTRGHSDRVSYYGVKLAQELGRDAEFTERIRVAGLFHDIGKIGVSDAILLKNSTLTKDEYDVIKTHPQRGAEILSALSIFNGIVPIVAAHHERIDGTGYPKGLTGDEIPEEARIISVADSFDAMTSHRRYRDNLSLAEAVSELVNGRGTQFDAHIADVFIGLLDNYDGMKEDLAWTYTDSDRENDNR